MEERADNEKQMRGDAQRLSGDTDSILTSNSTHDGKNYERLGITCQQTLDGNINSMEALPLNPGAYRGTYKLIGGRLSLDFVNTVSWPDTVRRHDWLDSVGNVVFWLNAVGLTARGLTRPDLVAIDALRTTLTAALRPLAHGKRPTRDAIDQLNQYVSASYSRRVIAPARLAWTWKPPRRSVDVFGPVVLDAAEVITGGRRDRLRYCPSCDWLFEDQTRNGQRRWCDMADCGSRDKAHRYYERTIRR